MDRVTQKQVEEYSDYPPEYDPSSNVYEESSLSAWTNSYNQMLKANMTGNPSFLQPGNYDRESGEEWSLESELQERPPPWWVPFIIIAGLIVIILIVVATAVYCGLRGTFGEPTTPKKRYDPSEEDAKSDNCSSVRLEIRSESRATCISSRAGCMSMSANETTEMQTLLVVPSNSQTSIQPEPRRLDFHNLGAFEPQKSLIPNIPPPPPSPIVKSAAESAADTQTEDNDSNNSCSL